MKRFSHLISTLIFLVVILMPLAFADQDGLSPGIKSLYDQGVHHYRDGQYEDAYKTFLSVTHDAPEFIESHYYLAITCAQLGRIKDARVAYQDVIRLAPNSEAAKLAKDGLSYLPEGDQLDVPPKLQARNPKTQDQSQDGQSMNAASNPFGNMDPKAMEMMMLMSSMGGNGGGFNPMMIPMMQSFNKGNPGGNDQNQIPPEVYSSMMMNQMMQNFSPFGSDKRD